MILLDVPNPFLGFVCGSFFYLFPLYRDDRFFSFTQTDSTLSIIMDAATMSLFPDHTLNTQEGAWRLISIGDGPLGFDQCGIVSEYSTPLSEQDIGLFYLSTFSSDYIMVSDQDYERALECLKEAAEAAMASSSSSPPQLDTRSVRSIDTSSLSGSASDVEAAELSPVSTNSDSVSEEAKGEEAEGQVEEEVAA